MPVDLDKIRALLASVAGFTPGPWRMSIENGSGIVAGHRHAVVSADSSALGWPVVLVERRSRPVMLAAPDLHSHLTEAVAEIEQLRDENGHLAALIKAGAWETSLAVAPLNAEIGRLRAALQQAKMAARFPDASDAWDQVRDAVSALDEVPDAR